MDKHPQLYRVDGSVDKPRLPTLLIVDGASTHISGEAFEYAKQQGMGIILLPPNLTHLMQVADVSIFGPFKMAYREACENWRHINKHDMHKFDIARVTGEAWQKAMTAHNALSGFRKTGQWPFDPSAVLDQVLFTHTSLSLR